MRRWTVVGVGCLVAMMVMAGCSDDDSDEAADSAETDEASTVESTEAAGSTEAATDESSAAGGPSWCARTTAVFTEFDESVGVLDTALAAWMEEAPDEIADAVRTWEELAFTPPRIAAANPDHESELDAARDDIDEYVSDNC